MIENTRLREVVATGKAEVGAIQRMQGAERVVSRVPIKRNGRVLGGIGRVMFRGPQQLESLSQRIKAPEGELEFYKRETATLRGRDYGLEQIIGQSPAVQRLRAQIVKVAPLEIPVLIRGESGTDKELVAHALHQLSSRRDRPMINVNAAALPPNLVESELFGCEPDAFTGADKKGRKGKFEQAEGGTTFLDEIGDMPLERQLSPRSVLPPPPIVIEVPPLRERIDGIPLLVDKFLQEIAYRHARPIPRIGSDAIAELTERAWPGNIRQLQHEIERAFVFSDGITIDVQDLSETPKRLQKLPSPAINVTPASTSRGLKKVISDVQDEQTRDAIAACGGNKRKPPHASVPRARFSTRSCRDRECRTDLTAADAPSIFHRGLRLYFLISGHSLSESGRYASSAGMVATTFIRSHSPFDSEGFLA